MKRFFLFFLAIVCLAGCMHKEGKLYTSHCINDVVAVESRYMDEVEYYTTGTYVSETWNWNGKELYRIDYRGDHPYSENLFYEGSRLSWTTIPAYGIRMDYFYDGRKLDRIEVSKDDEPLCRWSFFHDGTTLDKIVCHQFSQSAPLPSTNPLSCYLGNEVSSFLVAQCMAVASERKEESDMTYNLLWADDELKEIQCDVGDTVWSIKLSYDNKWNPYCQLWGYREMNDPIFGFDMVSRHNVVSIEMPYNGRQSQLFTFSYEYEDDYPVKRILNYTYPSVNETTWDSVDVRYQRIETIHYK